MTPQSCARKWEVEAARDGRLRGKDLESALRHRATCAECSSEERHLAALTEGIARLPDLPLDAVTARRARQHLMAALNDSILEPAPPKSRLRRALVIALASAAAVAGWRLLPRPRASSTLVTSVASNVEVRPHGDVRWSEQIDRAVDRVFFVDGAAAFTVRPHPGRRVVVQLPDGEAEDLGTVFELRVRDRQTRHISVSEGRVTIRLRDRPAFFLGAGDVWNSDSSSPSSGAPPSPAAASALPSISTAMAPAASAVTPTPSAKSVPLRAHVASSVRTTPSSSAAPQIEAPDMATAKAEDEAYLGIVDALRRGENTEALTRAKSYLLRFPNGFRRVEVLNIAMRGADAGASAPNQ